MTRASEDRSGGHPVERPDSVSATDFFATAARHGLLAGDPEEYRRESRELDTSPAEFVLRRGLLDAVAVDIVHTLLRPTDSIPGYEIERVLGRGAMGVVYRARQRNLDRVVALKTILVSQMSAPSSLERFELEGRTIGKLRHPNIIAAYDLGRNDGRLFLAMEFIEGTDLAERLEREGPLDEATTWLIARQAAAGLDHAAREGVVHRDVKPANLMLVEPPVGYPFPAGVSMVKIADFGLALLSDAEPNARLTTENTTLGSPYYMAPEQFRSSHVDHVADIYALGASVYHALAGRPPFAGMGVAQIIGAKFNEPPRPLERIRPGLSRMTYDLVDRLLERDPNVRIRTYSELIAEIDEIVGTPGGTGHVGVRDSDPNVSTQLERPTVVNAGLVTAALPATTNAVGVAPLLDRPSETTFALPGGDSATTAPAPSSTEHGRLRGSLPRWATGSAVLLALLLVLFVALDPLGLVRGGGTDPSGDGIDPSAKGDLAPAATEPDGLSKPLFDGVSLEDWRRRYGNWVVPVGEGVLAGTNGVVTRLLLEKGPDGRLEAPEFYRFDLILHPRTDERRGTHEVHFGITRGKTEVDDGPRLVLRRTADGVELGSQPSDEGPFTPGPDGVVRVPGEDNVAVDIERNPNGWFVKAAGTRFTGRPLAEGELPEFRLRANSGTAWFSDVVRTDLRPADAE